MQQSAIFSAVLLILQWTIAYSGYIVLTLFLITTNILNHVYMSNKNTEETTKTIAPFNSIHGYGHFDTIKTISNSINTDNSIFAMMELIKKHSNYKIMQQNKPLTTRELIGLILYTYSRGYCNKMKQSRNDWYVDTSNAIEKIY
eukprot:63669_1